MKTAAILLLFASSLGAQVQLSKGVAIGSATTAAGGSYAVQYDNGGVPGGSNFSGFLYNNGTTGPPSSATAAQGLAMLGFASATGSGNRLPTSTGSTVSGNVADWDGSGNVVSSATALANLPLLNGTNTFSAVQTFGAGLSVHGSQTLTSVLGPTGTELCAFTGTLTINSLLATDGSGNCTTTSLVVSLIPLTSAAQGWTATQQFDAGWISLADVNLDAGNATSGTNLNSPNWKQNGAYFNGSASTQDTWMWTDVVGTGTAPTSIYTLTHTGSSGAMLVSLPANTEAPTLQLTNTSAGTCSASIAGQFQYTQGNSTTKDVVQVCAHDASNAYAWRTIY